MINFKLVNEALDYYTRLGYKYIDVPFVVSPKALNITCPLFVTKIKQDTMVASGEQSFLQLILDKRLDKGRYVCFTPCYRPFDKNRSPIHLEYFYKVELIDYVKTDHDDLMLLCMVYYAKEFFEKYKYKTEIITINDDKRECETYNSKDIICNDIELGSYSSRWHKDIGHWVCGTGLALPRFQV